MELKTIIITLLLGIGGSAFSQDELKNSTMTDAQSSIYKGSSSPVATQHYLEATTFGLTGDYKTAIEHYQKAIDEDPNFVEAYDDLGLAYRKLEQYDKAVEAYKNAIRILPEGPMAHQNLATVYTVTKNYEGAVLEYQELLNIQKDDPEGYFGLASAYLMQSKFDDALRNAELALSIYEATASPLVGEGYQMVGLVQYYRGYKDKAKAYFKKARIAGVQLHERFEREFFSGVDSYMMDNPEDYAQYKQDVVDGFNWLMKTPFGRQIPKSKDINAFLIAWMSGSPSISIAIDGEIVNFSECSQCLVIFMAGWAVHSISADGKVGAYEGNMKGIEAVIKYYQANKEALGKNKGIEKYLKMKKKNELEAYIKSKV